MFRLYDFKCTECGFTFERIVRDGEMPACPECHMPTYKMFPVININMGVGAYGYYDENLDKPITTNRQRKEEMRKQGVTPKGETPKPTGEAWV